MHLAGLSAVRLDTVRAGLDPAAPLVVEITADGPGVLRLDGAGAAGRDLTYGAGAQRVTLVPAG